MFNCPLPQRAELAGPHRFFFLVELHCVSPQV
jgi:hypothetical protein